MTQPQREALLDLVIVSIFIDSHLSTKEDDALQTAFAAIGWEAAKPRDIFILNSMNRARKACDSDGATAEYVKARAAAFTDADSQGKALALLQQVFSADGTAASETEFLARVKSSFA